MLIGAVIPTYGSPHFLKDTIKSVEWVDKIVLVEEEFNEDTDQAAVRNRGLKQLDDFDYIFVLDSDEILLRGDASTLLSYARYSDKRAFGAKVIQYIGDLEHVSNYDDGHYAVTLVKGGTRLHNIRCCSHFYEKVTPAKLHHLKFLQPWEDLEARTKTKVEKRKFGEIKQVACNNTLKELVKAHLHDNRNFINVGDNF